MHRVIKEGDCLGWERLHYPAHCVADKIILCTFDVVIFLFYIILSVTIRK